MKIANKIMAVLLALTLASQGLAWDDKQEKRAITSVSLSLPMRW